MRETSRIEGNEREHSHSTLHLEKINKYNNNKNRYMTEGSWNWRMMKSIFTECHVYDESRNYAAFDDGDEEPFFAMQRRLLPETM